MGAAGLGEFGCEYEEGTFFEKSNEISPFLALSLRKVVPITPFSDLLRPDSIPPYVNNNLNLDQDFLPLVRYLREGRSQG